MTKVISATNESIIVNVNESIAAGLMALAHQFPKAKIIWCNELLENSLNLDAIAMLFHHDKMMLSYTATATGFLGNRIGFVEESPFIKVNKECRYPTWQMSSVVGIIHASVLNALKDKIVCDADFDYYLSSIAKIGMPLGLLCYSEPRLLKSRELKNITISKASIYTLFRFVKQHYKTRWVFLLGLNLALYEKQFSVIPLLCSLFYKNRKNNTLNLDTITVESSRKVIDKVSLDVIIPTIGRKNYLYDVLKDFSKQTFLPNKIIIVEQNPEEYSKSELDYIEIEKWPFKIEHFFIKQAGACNARNLALKQVESEWVFLADDDNRFDSDLIQVIFESIQRYGNKVVTTAYPQQNEIKKYKKVIQWSAFGAGNSFVKKSLLDQVRFTKALEFGYGEDSDFGMQLRNLGQDILYFPEPEILHLKAPIGGFRTKPVLRWHADLIQPKPSPTVLFYILTHNTLEQLCCYKTNLFIKYYFHQAIKNPFRYYFLFQKQWEQSEYWANVLKKEA